MARWRGGRRPEQAARTGIGPRGQDYAAGDPEHGGDKNGAGRVTDLTVMLASYVRNVSSVAP